MASRLLLYTKDRLELKLGRGRRIDHELIATLLGRSLLERTGTAGNFDKCRTRLERRAAWRMRDDLHPIRSEPARGFLEGSVCLQMPFDLLRFARLDPVANLQRAFRIEGQFSSVALERGIFRIGARSLTHDPRLRHLDDADLVERFAGHSRPHIVFSLVALSDAAHCDRI